MYRVPVWQNSCMLLIRNWNWFENCFKVLSLNINTNYRYLLSLNIFVIFLFRLSLNKTSYMIFGRHEMDVQDNIYISNVNLQSTEVRKFLGITIDKMHFLFSGLLAIFILLSCFFCLVLRI